MNEPLFLRWKIGLKIYDIYLWRHSDKDVAANQKPIICEFVNAFKFNIRFYYDYHWALNADSQ